ncbi:MAG: hypothetical protein NXI00_23855, partial [Cytophagales bacterium]|nr:hypothetical protein [Cytophagales bacterium]
LDENSNGEEDLKLKQANLDNMKKNFKRPGYNGDCLTTSLYFTTKRRLEMLIRLNTIRHRFKIFNCSDGLIIDKTHHLDSDKVIDIEMKTESDSKRFFESIRPFSANISQDLDNKLYKNIKELCDLLIKNVEQLKPDTFHLSALSWSISNYIDATFSKKSGSVVYFIRGSIWHYLVSGYSIAYAVTPENQEKVIKIWKDGFIDLLRKLPQDLHQAIHKPRPSISGDPALRRTIKE